MLQATAEQEQIARLYRKFGRVIFRRCRALLGDDDTALDATQEVFLKLTKNVAHLDSSQGDPFSWIYRTATCHCLDVLRHRANTERFAVVWNVAPGAQYESYTERQLAAGTLAQFDLGTQAIAVGLLVDGMEQEEVASALGISSRTVRRRFQRFLTEARLYLARASA